MRFLILFALLGTALAAPKTVSRIVGGQATTIENHPFMANMQYNLYNVWWTPTCGGTILTSTMLLSAAHCYYGDSPSQWRAKLGSSLASGGGSTHRVLQFIIHQQYNTPLQENDIALVRLLDRGVYSLTLQAARIPGPTFPLADGIGLNAIGWGSFYQGGNFPDQLQQVELNIVNQTECAARYASLNAQSGSGQWPQVSDGMMCAAILDVGSKNACQGDFGGPLVYAGDIIVGITSWNYRCADPIYPSVNTRVSEYSNWIVGNNM